MKQKYMLYVVIGLIILSLMFSNIFVEFMFGLPLSPYSIQCPKDVDKETYRKVILCPYSLEGNKDSSVWISIFTSPTCYQCWKFRDVEKQLKLQYPDILFLRYDARVCGTDLETLPTTVVRWHQYNASLRGYHSVEDISSVIEGFVGEGS